MKSYRELIVWQKGIELAKSVYCLTRAFPEEERYALSDQMRRAAVSISSNIAEGHARQHTKEFRQFLSVSLGSLAELDTQLVIASELGYVRTKETKDVVDRITELQKMTSVLLSRLAPNP